MYRIFLTASGSNVTINLTGQVEPNASTGQLTAVFSGNPQLPFSDLNLRFFIGPLAALATPESCGTFTTTSTITAYGSATANPSSSFNITGCASPTPFAPSFTAGTTNATAGAFSPFTLTFSRADSNQEFKTITATLPPGLFAKIAGVTQCTNAQVAGNSCPASSQVGNGDGRLRCRLAPDLPDRPGVPSTGPYNGGAYGLATVVPAVAGPYNLGTVTVRQALDINPDDAHVTAVSDPFPTILDGVPLRIKTMNLDLNRPDFIINPTSCQPFNMTATISSVGGSTSSVSSPFQVGSCTGTSVQASEVGDRPQRGRPDQDRQASDADRDSDGTAQRSGQPEVGPGHASAEPRARPEEHRGRVHGGQAAAAIACPSNTIVGTASAISPLLPDPLSGNVGYIVQGIGSTNAQEDQQIKTLPSLLIPLEGDHRPQPAGSDERWTAKVEVKLVTYVPARSPMRRWSNFKLTITGRLATGSW